MAVQSMDTKLAGLMKQLTANSPVEGISDMDIDAEVKAVRQTAKKTEMPLSLPEAMDSCGHLKNER